MFNTNFIDLCSDDEIIESNVKHSRRKVVPGFASAPSLCPTPISRNFWRAGDYEIEHGEGCKVTSEYVKNYMRIHPKFLHSNATSHKWAFGALAELLDNAVDEIQNEVTFVSIDMVLTPPFRNPALVIQDDGGGMDPEAIRRCMSFGFSDKNSKFTIGQYGNGFKTSSMRLGADVIVFSRHLNSRSQTQSLGLLSYTFLMGMGYDKIVVPMVDYEFNSSARTCKPIIPVDEDQFSSNLTLLLQWSPYSTEEQLLKQFDDIGDHGTKLIIYNLWSNDDGGMELDFDSDPEDIRIKGDKTLGRIKPNRAQHLASLYKHSLRAYASILYRKLPRYFRIILRGRDVEHRNIAKDLNGLELIKYKPRVDGHLEVEIITAIGFLKDAPHGFNIYHRNRLILPFWRALKNTTNNTGREVVGVLEPNYIQPTHNKQDFEKTSLFQKLEDRLKQMTLEYWKTHGGLTDYKEVKEVPSKALHFQTLPSSRTQCCVDQPLLLNHGSQNESSRSSSHAVGSIEDSEVTISDVTSRVLGKPADINNVRSLEEFVKKRKDLDAQVEAQHAKRHMESWRTDDVQYICEKPKDSVEEIIKNNVMQVNKMLRSELLALEEQEQQLNFKVEQLRGELEKVQQHDTELENELTNRMLESYTV